MTQSQLNRAVSRATGEDFDLIDRRGFSLVDDESPMQEDDMLALVAGVEPASPGFATVRIAPHLGSLDHLTASFPHPQGDIKVQYHRQGSGLSANITLPGSLTGTFVYNGRTQPLKPGLNNIRAE